MHRRFTTLRRHESASHSGGETKENSDRFNREREALRNTDGLASDDDPAFSPFYYSGDGNGKIALPAEPPFGRIFRV